MNLSTKLLTEGDPELVRLAKELDEWHGAAQEIPDERGGRVRIRINRMTLRQEAFVGGKWVEIGAGGQGPAAGAGNAGASYRDAVPGNWVEWTNVLSKPTTFTPSSHQHAGGDITSAVANATDADTLDGSHAAAFAAAAHTHTDLSVVEGANAAMGTAVLVGGTVTVNTTKVAANSRILCFHQVLGGSVGSLYISARTVGVSFTVTSSNILDTSTIAWLIVAPA